MSENRTLTVLNPLQRIRRNHALEHAALHVLGRKHKDLAMGGYSDMRGFWIIGDVSTEDIQQAVDEGLERLRNGESELAVHPNCGTNFAFMGLAAGTLAWLGMLNSGKTMKRKIERLPLIVTLVTAGLMLFQPVGPILQERLTTDANMGNLKIFEITHFLRRGISMHRVTTHQ